MLRFEYEHSRFGHLPALIGLTIVLLCLTLGGCASAPQQATATAGSVNILERIGQTTAARRALMRAAAGALGKPYRRDATGPAAFSDNGLVKYAYAHIGVDLPMAPHGLLGAGEPIAMSRAQPGDLVFYQTHPAGGPDSLRVGLFVNSNEMVFAAAKQGQVVVQIIDHDYWSQRLLGVVRILP